MTTNQAHVGIRSQALTTQIVDSFTTGFPRTDTSAVNHNHTFQASPFGQQLSRRSNYADTPLDSTAMTRIKNTSMTNCSLSLRG
jgi:hypothetical protein